MGIDSTLPAPVATAGVGLATAAIGGAGFHLLHKHAFKLGPEALQRSLPGPILAFGAIGLAVDATNRFGLQASDHAGWQFAQSAGTGAAIFAALTLASPMFHGTAQPIAVSTLVNAGLGAAIGAGVHLLTKQD